LGKDLEEKSTPVAWIQESRQNSKFPE